jgi:hypothetical protein
LILRVRETGVEPAVQAAIVAGSVALGVAVIGVIATGMAQVRGAKTAHANALALFERQADQQRQLHHAEARERTRLAHLEDRKSAYLKFQTAIDTRSYVTAKQTRIERELKTLEETDIAERMRLLTETADLSNQIMSLLDDMLEAMGLIQLVAPQRVINSAVEWGEAARDSAPDMEEKRNIFLDEARIDLGVHPRAKRLAGDHEGPAAVK